MLIRSVLSLAATVCLAVSPVGIAVAAVPAGDTLYPDSAKAFFSVSHVPQLKEHWETTQLFQLIEDPVMKPFADDLRRQLDDKWLANHERIGLSIDDLHNIASGELSGAIVGTTTGKTGFVVLVDVTGNEAKAKEALNKADQNLAKDRAKKSHKTVAGTQITIYDLPAKEDRLDARRVAYFLRDGLLAGADSVEALADVLARVDGKQADSLATLAAYQTVSKRLAQAAGDLAPDVRWYIDPLGVAEFRAQGNDKRLKNLKMLRNQGFAAIQGVGGYINLGLGEYEVLHRTAVYAPKPFDKAMGMLDFPNTSPAVPPAWVPRDVVTFTSMNWEIKAAFERFSTLFDELFGEGSEGTFNDTIDSVRDDPNGPGIDIRKDLVGHLGTRAVVITDYKLPITPSSERFAFAAETTNEPALAAAVQKSLETDDNVIKRVFKDYIIWEMKAEDDAVAAVVVERPDEQAGDQDALALNDKAEPKAPGGFRAKMGEEEDEPVQLPNAAVAVARGHLFISSHVDFLEKILAGVSDQDRLENEADFQRVNDELKKLGAKQVCIRNFTRADEQLRITYDLFKAGKLPESETVLAQIIRSAQEEESDGTLRKPKFDGSKLPDYQVARRYLGIGGTYISTEENGWIVVGFLFRKESAEKSLASTPDVADKLK